MCSHKEHLHLSDNKPEQVSVKVRFNRKRLRGPGGCIKGVLKEGGGLRKREEKGRHGWEKIEERDE